MNIKKFSDFSLNENNENKETIEDKIEDIKDAHNETSTSEEIVPFSSDLSDVGETVDTESDNSQEDIDDENILSDYVDFDSYNNVPEVTSESINTNGGSKIVIINGCEPDSEVDKKTEEFKSKCGVECKEIYLYQLNIQTPKKQEPKDGMQQIYDAIETADAVILACQVNKGKLSDSLETAIDRIKNHYKKEELKNKIFGAIVIGNEEKVKNDLILTALNDLHMIVCADCLCFCDKSSNMKKMIDSITTLSNATAMINNVTDEEKEENDDIKTFDKFSDDTNIDTPPIDNGLSEEESDNFVDTLKHMSNLSEDDAEEEVKTEEEVETEEEDRLIDNENGTITQIHDGEKITENKEDNDDFEIKPFDKFFE